MLRPDFGAVDIAVGIQRDPQGNLTQVTFPDSTTRTFGYDASNLMTSETEKRGKTAQRNYDGLGRFTNGTRKDGSTVAATNIQSVGFVDSTSGVGTEANPAPVVRSSDALSTLTDGKTNTTSFVTDGFGATTRQSDALGQETLIERDSNGNPTKITRPNGAVLEMTYDAAGNLLSSKDPVGATTTFTYEPNFNQVAIITDPKNNTTTINYDAKGNPVPNTARLNRDRLRIDARKWVIGRLLPRYAKKLVLEGGAKAIPVELPVREMARRVIYLLREADPKFAKKDRT